MCNLNIKSFSHLRAVRYLFAVMLLFESWFSYGQVSLPKVFGDGMILQRDIDIPIWGWAKPGTQIILELGNNRRNTIAGDDGKWMLRMPKMKAGGPWELTIYEDDPMQHAVKFENVLIGDVWLASGQSNMEWQVQQSANAEVEIKNANYPEIRFLVMPHRFKTEKQDDIPETSWEVCDSEHVREVSAVAYFFARELYSELNIPIGIIQSTWGGTPVEGWTSREQLLASPITHKKVLCNDTVTEDQFISDSLNWIRFWDIVYNPEDELVSTYSKENFDDADWPELAMPSTFKDWNMPFYEGMVWMRKDIRIPNNMLGKNLTINLGHPEMNYSLYVNGNEICDTVWNARLTHVFELPAEILHSGKNVIAVRMAVLWGGGGFNLPANEMYISNGKTKINLAGKWKFMKDLEPPIPKINNYHKFPSYLYNAMIHPLIPYAVKGFIWYQGEENVKSAKDYQALFPMLISDWRIRWEQGYLPFIYVQLANFMRQWPEPTESDWAELREAQTKTLSQPNTAMACIIDIGEANSIHPKNKQEVGRRLALLAGKMVYEKPLQASGPMYQEYKVEGNQVIIKFIETGSGLAIGDAGKLTGFAIAGADQKFYWADAIIDGDKVIVRSEKVSIPVAVRYAWADNPLCNLINIEGLPAIPFRTDDWNIELK